MRHRASRPFIDQWRRLPRATARPIGAAAKVALFAPGNHHRLGLVLALEDAVDVPKRERADDEHDDER